jgi:transposase
VVWHADGHKDVLVHGTVLGGFDKGDTTARNMMLVLVAQEGVVLEDLAHAFGVTSETVRLTRRAYEEGGYRALVQKKRGGQGPWKVTQQLKATVEACFAEGLSVPETRLKLKKELSAGTLRKLRREWEAARVVAAASAAELPAQQTLPLTVEATAAEPMTSSPQLPPGASAEGELAAKKHESGYVVRGPVTEDGRTLPSAGPRSAKHVPFLGSWLLVALAAKQGLHEAVETEASPKKKVPSTALRLAVDSVLVALAIGQGCVEGVRRLAHQGAPALLLSSRAPSPTWVRRTLGRAAADGHGFFIHTKASGELMRAAASRSGELAVFYVDGHLRPYTGLQRLLRGWRMQEKRALPGTTDLHVHDVDGRPLYRVATRMHDSLGKLLLPIGALLRMALGAEQRILLAFDRAASYPEVMTELRDSTFEFVAYERKPYPSLPASDFHESFVLDGERIAYCESRKNLGDGRGRVRRIALRVPGGHQVNLLAHSTAPARELAAIMAGRWNQENAFHHAVHRWGLNQLDGRCFPDFDAEAVIPSPMRRRLDFSLRVLREAEGHLRRKVARATADEVRARLEQELARNLKKQRRLEVRRPALPKHCTVEEAGLVGELKHHRDEYKAVLDTIRAAAINAEADLAVELATAMSRPREAKRLLQNFFSAPGELRVRDTFMELTLDVAAHSREHRALQHLCRVASSWKLSLPGDPNARPLRFRSQS